MFGHYSNYTIDPPTMIKWLRSSPFGVMETAGSPKKDNAEREELARKHDELVNELLQYRTALADREDLVNLKNAVNEKLVILDKTIEDLKKSLQGKSLV